ncbi:hypothetical protein [Lentibacillus sediminis]|uniref:hypothetical protein n=1 Tax=Lentibacillus sediminis TaxID=1940529 RepID=UPI000C1B9025|nr:hypothetical protein [Lentibacillus sediminis]
MQNQPKKKSPLPMEANQNGTLGVQDEVKANHPFHAEDNTAGNSVDQHKKLESANEVIAKKEISQVYNNS